MIVLFKEMGLSYENNEKHIRKCPNLANCRFVKLKKKLVHIVTKKLKTFNDLQIGFCPRTALRHQEKLFRNFLSMKYLQN